MSRKTGYNIARHIVWSDADLNLDDWRDDLLENAEVNGYDLDPNDEDALYKEMVETNERYLEDERVNLDIQLDRPIVVIAKLGLWDGPHNAYKEIESGNIKDCLYSLCGSNCTDTWYVDAYGDLRCDETHHDGTNHYRYRVWREKVSEAGKERFRTAVLEGRATNTMITNYTKSIGVEIADVFGWDVRGSKENKRKMAAKRAANN